MKGKQSSECLGTRNLLSLVVGSLSALPSEVMFSELAQLRVPR
jgi:hypothetical protein